MIEPSERTSYSADFEVNSPLLDLGSETWDANRNAIEEEAGVIACIVQ